MFDPTRDVKKIHTCEASTDKTRENEYCKWIPKGNGYGNFFNFYPLYSNLN